MFFSALTGWENGEKRSRKKYEVARLLAGENSAQRTWRTNHIHTGHF